MESSLFFSLILLLVSGCALFSGYPVAISLAGSSIAMALIASMFGAFDPSLLIAIPNRIFAAMTNPVLVAVPLFIFMGAVLDRSRIAEDLLQNLGLLLNRQPAGLALAVCMVGALLAASTGIVGATVVTMGLLALPTMLKRGYDPAIACGTICAAGTLGQIIPPSIVLILLADQLAGAWQQAQYARGNFAPDAVSVNEMFAGALLPGLLLVGLYMAYLMWRGQRNPTLMPVMDITERDPASGANHEDRPGLIRSLIPPLGLIIVVLGSILMGIASTTEAAAVGAVGALLLADRRLRADTTGVWPSSATSGLLAGGTVILMSSIINTTGGGGPETAISTVIIVVQLVLVAVVVVSIGLCVIHLQNTADNDKNPILTNVIKRTVSTTSMIFLILIGASVFSLVLRGFGADILIRDFLSALPGGFFTAFIVVMATMFLLGFVLDFLEIVFIVVPIIAPILFAMDVSPGIAISPVWLGIMIALNLQTSFLTPPFGLSLFYLRAAADDSVPTIAMYRGVIPFVLIQLFVLIILWFIPSIATWLPEQLYGSN